MMNDSAVSELMGYTVLVAVVSIAAAGLLAGSMGTLSASEMHMEYSGAVSALEAFGDVAANIVETNNTYDTAFEMTVPRGCDLIVSDAHDDFRSMGIYSGASQLTYLPMGSLALRSPLRSAAFEGGAIISNDTGLVKAERSPAAHAADLPSGKKALYVSVTAISGDSFIKHPGDITLFMNCSSVKTMSWHIPDGSAVTIRVRSGDPQAWKDVFEHCGMAVTDESGAVRAVSTQVSDVYVTYAEANIHV